MRDYDKEPLIIKDSIIDYIEFTEKLIKLLLFIFVIICFLFLRKNYNSGFNIVESGGSASGLVITAACLRFTKSLMDKYSWRKGAYIYFYNNFIEVKGEYVKTLELSNIEKIKDFMTYSNVFYKKLKLYTFYFFIFVICVYLYTYYSSKYLSFYIMTPLEVILKIILPFVLFIMCYIFTIFFAFRLKKRLSLNLLEGNMTISTSDYTLDIYFLNKEEFNEIKEYFSQRTKFKG